MFKLINSGDCVPYAWKGSEAVGIPYTIPMGGPAASPLETVNAAVCASFPEHKIVRYIRNL